MQNYLVSPDDCLILKAFRDASSLREAAQLLNCDPAGLTRRAQAISTKYGQLDRGAQLLQKVNNRWSLTARGLALVAWTESTIQSQRLVLSAGESLRLATTMWFSDEVLVPQITTLRESLGERVSIQISVPDKSFELSLIDGSVDFVVVCHPPESPEIAHRAIANEEWVVVAPRTWRKAKFEDIKQMPFIRHSTLNTDLFLGLQDLCESGLSIDHLIGIRRAVCEGLGWSIVPKLLVRGALQEAKVVEVAHPNLQGDRKVCLWWLRSRGESKRTISKLSAWLREIL